MRNNYGVFYPYESFNVGQRFFFFNSLKENTNIENSSNQKSGVMLASEVESTMLSHMPDIDPTQNGLQQIKNVLNFLQSVITYERTSEENYFKSYLERADLPPALKTEFSTLRDPATNAFDYIKFINLINTLYNGQEGYKALLQYERKRLDQIQTVINQFLALDKDSQKVFNKKTGEKEDKGFYANFRNYLWQNSNSSLIKAVNNTKTFSNRVQEKIQSAITNLWDTVEWKKIVQEFLQKKSFHEPLDDSSRRILTIQLFSECLPKIKASVTRELIALQKEEREYNFIDANKLKNIIKQEATQYVNLNLIKDNPHYAADAMEEIYKELEQGGIISLNDDTRRFIKLTGGVYTKSTKKEETLELTKDAVKILKDAVRNMGQIPEKDKQALINQFVNAYSQKNAITFDHTLTNDEIIDFISKHTDIGKLGTVVNFYIATKDNLISEAFAKGDGLLMFESDEVLKKMGLAGGYQKMDTFGIKNFNIGNIITTLDDKKLQSYFSSLCDQITKTYFDSINIQKDSIHVDESFFKEDTFRAARGFGSTEFMIQAETKRRLLMIQQLCNQVRKDLEQESIETDTINKIINSIKNTIQISTTVKSYNRYRNDEGFHGGSLGGSVETQLQNVYKMFSYGGVTLPDIDWMTFAVYNSGDNMVGGGETTRHSIENILSAVAGMLLFDDAGEQALYIKSQLDNYIYQGSTNFLHLYHLNDFYFPSSFILQLTYDGLLKAYNLLESEAGQFSKKSFVTKSGTGANIKIINNISEFSEYTDETSDWINYFDKNKKKVALTITFLGGLLDIIEELNDAMASYK